MFYFMFYCSCANPLTKIQPPKLKTFALKLVGGRHVVTCIIVFVHHSTTDAPKPNFNI